MSVPLLPVILGPTASGKTALAVAVAERLGLEVVGLDSRQVYAGLEVATAAPTAAERARVPHRLAGHVGLVEAYSAGRWCREARAVLGLPPADAAAAAEPPAGPLELAPGLLAGGSGFYLRAFLDPVDPRLAAAAGRRAEVKALGAALGPEGLKARLVELDPAAAWIPAADRAKVERHLEICLAAGMPARRALRGLVLPRPVAALLVALEAPPAWIDARVRARGWRMLHHGMVDEIRAALAAGAPVDGHALSSVGAADVQAYLAGEIDLVRCHERLARGTRRYAKKQRTWIRGLGLQEELLRLDARRPPAELADEVVAAVGRRLREGGGR